MSMDKIIREEARLILLKALAGEPDRRSNSSLLAGELERFAITRSRDWVHAEMRFLEEIGAIRVVEADSVLIGELTRRGQDHVDRRIILDGVKRPSPPEA